MCKYYKYFTLVIASGIAYIYIVEKCFNAKKRFYVQKVDSRLKIRKSKFTQKITLAYGSRFVHHSGLFTYQSTYNIPL